MALRINMSENKAEHVQDKHSAKMFSSSLECEQKTCRCCLGSDVDESGIVRTRGRRQREKTDQMSIRAHYKGKRRRSSSVKRKSSNSERCPACSLEDWKATLKELSKRTIYAPPVYMNKQLMRRVLFADQETLISEAPVMTQDKGEETKLQDSAVRDDDTQRHFLFCLRALTDELSEHNVMTVVSQLRFEDYLKGLDDTSLDLPRPEVRGDIDCLVIHPAHGLLMIEIKAIGDRNDFCLSEEAKEQRLLKTVSRGIKQLNKGKQVLAHLVSDKKPSPPVKVSLVMPNVEEAQLRRLLKNNAHLKEDLCNCLGIDESTDPLTHCLYAERLSGKDAPYDVTGRVMKELRSWWTQTFAESNQEQCMTADDYCDLLARFCGPATYATSFSDMKEVRTHYYQLTVGQAVSDIGDRFDRPILTQKQLDVLNEGLPLRFLCGPPGTGKTVVLILMACKWLTDHPTMNVHIVSTWSGSLAASHLIICKLKELCPGCDGRLKLHEFDLKQTEGVVTALETLLRLVRDDKLFVICDEAHAGSEFIDFSDDLDKNCKALHLWAANVYHGFCPTCLKKEVFTEPLRTAPIVTQEVARSEVIGNQLVHTYSTSPAPYPCDGPPPILIQHQDTGHTRGWPGDCEKCGEELGHKLRELHDDSRLPSMSSCISRKASTVAKASNSGDANTETRMGPRPLEFRDFFIVTTYYELVDEQKDDDDEIVQEASGLLKSLRALGIPYRVVEKGDSAALAEVAAKEGPDAVVVAEADTIRGLERKVVVWVESEVGGNTSGDRGFARLDAMSRTTAQLIIVSSDFSLYSDKDEEVSLISKANSLQVQSNKRKFEDVVYI